MNANLAQGGGGGGSTDDSDDVVDGGTVNLADAYEDATGEEPDPDNTYETTDSSPSFSGGGDSRSTTPTSGSGSSGGSSSSSSSSGGGSTAGGGRGPRFDDDPTNTDGGVDESDSSDDDPVPIDVLSSAGGGRGPRFDDESPGEVVVDTDNGQAVLTGDALQQAIDVGTTTDLTVSEAGEAVATGNTSKLQAALNSASPDNEQAEERYERALDLLNMADNGIPWGKVGSVVTVGGGAVAVVGYAASKL